jgi:flagellar hook-length control protein FliK
MVPPRASDHSAQNAADPGIAAVPRAGAAAAPAALPVAETAAPAVASGGPHFVPGDAPVPVAAETADRTVATPMSAVHERVAAQPGLRIDAVAPVAVPLPAQHQPTVSARPGAIGREIGIEIARHGAAGSNMLIVRLDPPDLGRIDVHIRFDDRGTLRASVVADSAVALDMLRQDSGALGQALTGAGVATDTQSFSFDTRGNGGGQSQGRPADPRPTPSARNDDVESEIVDPAIYRPLRWTGQVDVMA